MKDRKETATKPCKPYSYVYKFVYAVHGFEFVHECENCEKS